jgi:hypothetical protein
MTSRFSKQEPQYVDPDIQIWGNSDRSQKPNQPGWYRCSASTAQLNDGNKVDRCRPVAFGVVAEPHSKADNWIPVTNWSTRKVDGFRLSLENHHEGSNLGNSCLCRERLRWRYCPKITARRLPTCSRRCMCSCACLASNMPGPLLGSDWQISRRVSTPWRTTCCLPGRVGVAAPSQASCAQKDISLCLQALEIGWQRSKHPTNLMN